MHFWEAKFADRLRTRTGMALVLAGVFIFALLLYLPTIRYDFVWDDNLLIIQNQQLAESSLGQVLTRGFWEGSPDLPAGPARFYYRPLTTLSFWLDLKLAGPNPAHFHLVNIILNALVCVLLCLIVWELLHSGLWAGLAGILFAAHPNHVESTAFISGRTDLLAGLFILLATFALLRSLRKRNLRWWPLVPTAFFFALLSKETVFLFPLLVALAPLLTQTSYDRRYWILLLTTLLAVGVYFVLRAWISKPLVPPDDNLFNTLVPLANTAGLYLKMLFWPFTHKAKFPQDPGFNALTPYALALLLFSASVLLLGLRRRFRIVLFGFALVVLFLLPVTLVRIGPQAAERLNYLPSAGLVLIIITYLSRQLHTRPALRRLAGLGLLSVLVILARDTLDRSQVWRNEITLFSAMIREAPQAPSAYGNLAAALRATKPDSAIKLYHKALSLDQGYLPAHIDLGVLYGQKGDFRQAIHHLRIANELSPNSPSVLTNLGNVFLAAGKPDSAAAYLQKAVAIAPQTAPVRLNYAQALDALGNTALADSQLRLALSLDSQLVPVHLALSERFERAGELESSVVYLHKAARLNSTQPATLNRLGTLLVRMGDTARAETNYVRALTLDSLFLPALYNRAILCASRGDSAQALTLAEQAYRLRPDLSSVRDLYFALRGDRR